MKPEHMKRWHNGGCRSWQELDGKEASMLIFPDGGKVYGQAKGHGGPILCDVRQYTQEGDFMVFMIEHNSKGEEVARHNANHIESILWVLTQDDK